MSTLPIAEAYPTNMLEENQARGRINHPLGLTEYFLGNRVAQESHTDSFGSLGSVGRMGTLISTKQASKNRQVSVRKLMVAGSLGLMLAVSGCAKSRITTGSVPPNLRKPVSQMNQAELRQATDFWQQQYVKSPKSKQAGLQFATALRVTGRNEQALAVMQQVAIHHPKDRAVLGAYGKALAGAGQLEKALQTIQRAQTPDNPDWKLHSAEGAIYDQSGQPKLARLQYRKALDLKPGEPSVLSNLGMSYLLAGDLRSAETYLKQAISRPNADSRVRQNLALVIGLQGRFKEAETVAAGELPPQEAQANVKFLRQMLSEQNAWNELKDKK